MKVEVGKMTFGEVYLICMIVAALLPSILLVYIALECAFRIAKSYVSDTQYEQMEWLKVKDPRVPFGCWDEMALAGVGLALCGPFALCGYLIYFVLRFARFVIRLKKAFGPLSLHCHRHKDGQVAERPFDVPKF